MQSHDTAKHDSSYFSDDDIPSDKNEEVDDDYFNMHFMDSKIPYQNVKAKKETDPPQDTLELEPDMPVTVIDIIAKPNDKCVNLTNLRVRSLQLMKEPQLLQRQITTVTTRKQLMCVCVDSLTGARRLCQKRDINRWPVPPPPRGCSY